MLHFQAEYLRHGYDFRSEYEILRSVRIVLLHQKIQCFLFFRIRQDLYSSLTDHALVFHGALAAIFFLRQHQSVGAIHLEACPDILTDQVIFFPSFAP